MKIKQLFESSELIALYGWFHEYIEDNNIDLVDEFEDGKILIYNNGEVLHSLDLKEAKEMKERLNSPDESYWYAQDVIKGEWKLGELIIATYDDASLYYAKDVIKGRFKLGEPAIAKYITFSKKYKEFLETL